MLFLYINYETSGLALLVLYLFLSKNKDLVQKSFVYLLGLAVGLVPLLYYLFKYHIVKDFLFWVIKFNGSNLKILSIFPLVPIGIAFYMAIILWKKWSQERNHEALILLVAFILSTLSSLFISYKGLIHYYLQYWYVLCAILCCGFEFPEEFIKIKSPVIKTTLLGALGVILVFSNSDIFYGNGNFSNNKKSIEKILQYSENNNSLVFIPENPIFVHDSIRLYTNWQWTFLAFSKALRADILQKGRIIDQLILQRPAVIEEPFNGISLIDILKKKRMIGNKEYAELTRYLIKYYVTEPIGSLHYHIRKDIFLESQKKTNMIYLQIKYLPGSKIE